MIATLQAYPIDAGPEGRGYLLDLVGDIFGFLYVSEFSYTLAWNGHLDFSYIERKAIESLGFSLGFNIDIDDIIGSMAVTMIFPVESDWDELLEFRLGTPDDYARYREALQHSDSIAFARYDIDLHYQSRFAFIAQNPKHVTGDTEVALVIPKRYPILSPLLAWISLNHANAEMGMRRFDLAASGHRINHLVRSFNVRESDAPTATASRSQFDV